MGGKGAVRSASFFPHYNYNQIVRGGWFPISFIDVPAKNAKLLKFSLEGGGEKVWGANV